MAGVHQVLVVEADPLTRLGLEQVLRREGFDPTAVGTVADALPLLTAFTILLIDPELPDAPGTAVFDQIAAQKLPMRVGILSALPRSDPSLAGLAFGNFFEKPITRDKLDLLVTWLKALPPARATP